MRKQAMFHGNEERCPPPRPLWLVLPLVRSAQRPPASTHACYSRSATPDGFGGWIEAPLHFWSMSLRRLGIMGYNCALHRIAVVIFDWSWFSAATFAQRSATSALSRTAMCQTANQHFPSVNFGHSMCPARPPGVEHASIDSARTAVQKPRRVHEPPA